MLRDKKWILKPVNEDVVARIRQDLNIHPALSRLLALRGIAGFESARTFFRPNIEHLHDPLLMMGMQDAITRIDYAIKNDEKIRVYGDYDVDGTTSVAVLYSFLIKNTSKPQNISFYIPHRYREGYGISFAGIDDAAEAGCSLMIALDCGIKSVDKAEYARSKGIDLIICDHHLPDEVLPNAVAILNPKQKNCPYPYKELSGCGIGYKLICALQKHWQLPDESTNRYLDLVATSIAADIVPIDGENRVLAYYGLKRANEQPCLAIQTLKQLSALNRALNVSDLVFVIAPRINAAGRMDDARKAVEFFVEEDLTASREMAEMLHADNFDRREVDRTMTDEALQLLQADALLQEKRSTVLYQPHWHKGVVGIVASRLIDHYYRPTIVLTESNGKITGSARSVSGFNIYEAIHECRDLLENYGGHFFAAGLTMVPEKLPAFQQKFESVVRSTIAEKSLHPEIEIDAVIELRDINQSFYKILRQFEPFGPANLRPVFMSQGVFNNGYSKVVKEMHIRFSLMQHGVGNFSGIGFGMADKFDIVSNGAFDIVYTIDENEWNGNSSLQLKVIDIRPAQKIE